jgi:hypothetical protein
MSTPTLTPDRQTFRALVADVAARAKARLPEAVNGRIESAVKLVLAYDVTPRADGTVEVGSSSDPIKTYTVVGKACDCQDFAYGKAPQGWCQHRLAAAIQQRVQELLPPAPEPEIDESVAYESWSKAQEEVYQGLELSQQRERAATPALPEAPASVNVRIQIDGREVQWTLRDTDEGRLAERLTALLARYPQPQAPAQPPASQRQEPREGYCAIHQVQMRWNEGTDGRKGWWSHMTADGWCQGRRPRRPQPSPRGFDGQMEPW